MDSASEAGAIAALSALRQWEAAHRCAPLRPTLPLEYFPSGLHARVGSLKRVCGCPATALAARFALLVLLVILALWALRVLLEFFELVGSWSSWSSPRTWRFRLTWLSRLQEAHALQQQVLAGEKAPGHLHHGPEPSWRQLICLALSQLFVEALKL